MIVNKDYIVANIKIYDKKTTTNSKLKALSKIIIEQFEEYIKVNKKLPSDLIHNLKSTTDSSKISDLISVNLGISIEQKQKVNIKKNAF